MFITATSMLIGLQSMTRYLAVEIQQIITSKIPIYSIDELLEYEFCKMKKDEIEKINSIAYENVGFSYDDERKLFNNISFIADKAGIYLIRGESGSGKSTLMNLLLGYYSPTQGRIMINNKNLTELKDINKNIAVLRQEAMFFEDSLRENIKMYKEIDDNMIKKYMDNLGLEKYANETLDEIIYNNGDNFSGGEKRRLAFIRTILKDSDIMILDEPFANIDRESVEIIAKLINNLEDKIIFLITHQLPDMEINYQAVIKI